MWKTLRSLLCSPWMGILMEEWGFLPYCVFLSPYPRKCLDFAVGTCCPSPWWAHMVWVFAQRVTGSSRFTPEWAGFLCGFFSTSYSSYPMDSCFHRTRASSAGAFCCQLHAHGCEGDPAIKTPSKLVYTTVSIISRKNDCQLLKADFNTNSFSKKKKKSFLVGWLFFPSQKEAAPK